MFDLEREVRYTVYEQAFRKIETYLVAARKEFSSMTDLDEVHLTNGVLFQALLEARKALE